MHLAARIRRARTGAGLSQEKLAARLEISEKTIRRWEKGTTEPSIEHASQVAHECGVDRAWLITGAGEDAA